MTDTQAIKDRIDIVALIQEYVPLKKAGINWKANCPFHNEKSPSFMVHSEKQIWHCFGCSKGGDIFSFIQEMEGLDFPGALKLLAARAGVQLENIRPAAETSQRNRLLEINETAANFFHRFLLEIPASKPAREYLVDRGLTEATIRAWRIGFAPDQWELLTKYLLKKGFGIDDIVASGLTIKKDDASTTNLRGFYDRFRGRIMFPLSDAQGTVLGFTGRVLVETEQSGGKYVNTPETPVFNKSKMLFGLPQAKTFIKSQNLAVLVEGQMDVISCHQAGMQNVVAASGTALTEGQLRILKRYTSNLAMAFDADSAGIRAGGRGADLALAEGFNVLVIQIQGAVAKDADECLKKAPDVWFKAVKDAREVMEWYFALQSSKLTSSVPRERQQAADLLLEKIAVIPHAIEQEQWLRRLGETVGAELGLLREELRRHKKGLGKAILSPTAIVPAVAPPEPATRQERLQEALWALLLKFPDLFAGIKDRLTPLYFTDPAFLALYQLFEQWYTNPYSLAEQLAKLSLRRGNESLTDVLELEAVRAYESTTPEQAVAEAENLALHLGEEWKKVRRRQLLEQLRQSEQTGDSEQTNQLLAELQKL